MVAVGFFPFRFSICFCPTLNLSTSLCTVTRFVGQGAFGEVYEVVWTGVGRERGATLAMKTVRLADLDTDKRDEYRVLLVEEILTVRGDRSTVHENSSH